MATGNHTIRTLKELEAKRNALHAEVDKKGQQVGSIWSKMIHPAKSNSKGELATTIIANSITAIDAFLLVRKIMAKYGHLFHKKKKKR